MFRTTAACGHSTSTLRRTWAGGGFMNPRAMRLTSVLGLVPICGAPTPSIPRYWVKGGIEIRFAVCGVLDFTSCPSCCAPSTGVGFVQHYQPRSVSITLLCVPGPGTPHHSLLHWQDTENRAAFQHEGQVLQVQLEAVPILHRYTVRDVDTRSWHRHGNISSIFTLTWCREESTKCPF